MKTACYLEIAIPCPLRRNFDYYYKGEEPLLPGTRVSVPFGARRVVGIVIQQKSSTSIEASRIKPIYEVLDVKPTLSADIVALCLWASDYYQYPIGEVFATALPKLLRKPKPDHLYADIPAKKGEASTFAHTLNSEQQAALDSIQTQSFHTYLLHGITGSGKTEVYFHLIDKVLAMKRQVLVLVPEISLTPQTLARFSARFAEPIASLHSGLTDKQRLVAWQAAKHGQARIVIGTRSAVFTPFTYLGLIIVDEEHDPSFKQHEGFRYHARDLAIMRAKCHQIPIVLGSATPALESYYNCVVQKSTRLSLTQRAGGASLPNIRCIDLNQYKPQEGLSEPAKQAITEQLSAQNQVLIFINRRGYAPVLFCQSCRWQASCERCERAMVWHKKRALLMCHHCGKQSPSPERCPECDSPSLTPIGEGTQRLDEYLAECFPQYAIIRVDKDSTQQKNAMNEHIETIHQEKPCLLIGTQMLAKGHHFPHVTLVVILDMDGALMSTDFRSPERMVQLITQVAGRAGRAQKHGQVLLQSYYPQHPLLVSLMKQTYETLLDQLLVDRKPLQLPPFSYLALWRAEAKQASRAFEAMAVIKKILEKTAKGSITVYDPIPAPMQKKAGFFRVQLLVQASQRPVLQQVLRHCLPQISDNAQLQAVRWSVDVDPMDMA